MMNRLLTSFLLLLISYRITAQQNFIQVKNHQFYNNGKPYYYIGANYWYASLLGLQKDKKRGIERLRKELDFLKARGVTNLRVLTGVEGTGQINGVPRVQPAFQKAKGVFDENQLAGLDLLLVEMGKRNMKAILFLSNNWEWSGGFLQYLNWNGLIPDSILRPKLTWDDLRDQVSKFYACKPCMNDYLNQVKILVTRTNKLNNKKYNDDAAIMAWELANEPRPMRSSSDQQYKNWISKTAAYIKSLDKNHLVTIGHEGI